MKRIVVHLPPHWIDSSKDNPNGPTTFHSTADNACGALQVSIQAEYVSGVIPNPSGDQLIAFAESIAFKDGEVDVRGRKSDSCALGNYGTILVRSTDYSWLQVWVLSNGKDFVLATHLCIDEPSPAEVNEASWIVKNIKLTKVEA
jgi:hypothetical protein